VSEHLELLARLARQQEGDTKPMPVSNATPLALIARLAQQQSRGKSAYHIAREFGFSGTPEQWLASLHGPRGLQGKSAYDLALEHGFVGSETDWLAYLKAEQGPRGPVGPPGPSGDIGPMPQHEWDGTKLRFEQEPGQWGRYVDLKGDKGESGDGGGVFGGTNGALIIPEVNAWDPSGW
jgi:hypothetical protein